MCGSLASQGMMLRGRMGQDNIREGEYTKLMNPTKEEGNQKEIPPQPPPLPSRSRSLSLPPYPAQGLPLESIERKELNC